MTITVDTGNISSKGNVANATSPQTWNHTTGANVDMIVVMVTIFDISATDGVVSGVTFDGKTLTSSFIEYDALCDGHVSVWWRANADIQSITNGVVSVSFGGTVTDFEASAVGVEGTVGSFDEDSVGTKATGTDGLPTVTWSVTAANTILFDSALSDQKDPKITADGTQVEIHNTDMVADHALASYDIQSGSGSKTMSWSDPDNDEDWVTNGAAFYEIVGATEYQQSADGVLTPAGGIIKSSGKIVAGITTLTGSISKATTKTFTGSSTLAGILVKRAQKIFTGLLTPSGLLSKTKVTLLSISGAITASGLLVKEISISMAGSVTAIGSLIRSTIKAITGSITTSGLLSTTKVTLLAIGGSITAAGVLIKQTSKTFIGSVTPVGTLIKKTAKAFTGSLTLSGILFTTKVTLLAIGGALAPAGTLVKRTTKTFIGSVTAAGSLAAEKSGAGGEQYYKAVGGVLTMAGAVFRHLLGLPTPPRRIYSIASEIRICSIASENRIYSVPRGV